MRGAAEEAVPVRGRRPGLHGGIGAASVVAAVLTWLLQVVVGQSLGPDGFARFMVVWGLVFTAVGVLQGLQQEVTRSVAQVRTRSGPPGAPVVGAAVIVALVGVVVITASAPWWAPRTGVEHPVGVLAVLVAVWITYAVAQTLSGVLAAGAQWSTYAWVIVLEALCRFVAVIVALLVSRTSAVLGLGLACGVLAWVLMSPARAMRSAPSVRAQGSSLRQAGRSGQAMLAAGCSALLISGFPVLLELTSSSDLGPGAGVFLAVLVASRAPLMLFLNAYQGIFITRFMASDRPLRPTVRASVSGAFVALLAAAASCAVGPPLVRLVFGRGFDAPPALFPALVAASLALGLLTMTGWAALARSQHAFFLLGWLAAVAVTTSLLVIPATVEVRSSVALVVGPLVGTAIHVLGLRRLGPRAAAEPTGS